MHDSQERSSLTPLTLTVIIDYKISTGLKKEAKATKL